MKARINTFINNIFFTPKHLPVGTYQANLQLDDGLTYRLHLRIENQGLGTLILNASTILHLNETATEFAYHLIKKTPEVDVVTEIMKRYRVTPEVASNDFKDFKERLEILVATPDLDPETFLNIDRVNPFEQKLSAPLRLDCAVTYQVSEGSEELFAPVDRAKKQLTTDEWKVILQNAWNAGIPHVVFTGGEPTLRPDMPELIKYSEELGQVSGLITDGIRLSEREYLHQLLQAGLDHLMIVLNPNDDQCWEAIRDSMNEDIFVTVHVTVTEKNIDGFEQILTRLRTMEVKSLSLSTSSPETSKYLTQITQKSIELGFSMVWDLPVPYSALNPITLELEAQEIESKGAGTNWLYVEPDGDVLTGQGNPKVLGNFLTDSWEHIWSEAKLARHD